PGDIHDIIHKSRGAHQYHDTVYRRIIHDLIDLERRVDLAAVERQRYIGEGEVRSDFNVHIGRSAHIYYRCVSVVQPDRKSTRLNSSHVKISYAVFCLKKKIK